MKSASRDMNQEMPALPFQAAAVLPAGGHSTRMGRDKRHMEISGTSLVTNANNLLSRIFEQVTISIGTAEIPVPGARHVMDHVQGAGPLGAVVSAMTEAEHPFVFVMARDIPEPPGTFIREMLIRAKEYDVVVPVDKEGRYETPFAVYRSEILPKLQSLLESGEKRIRRVYPMVNTLSMEIPSGVSLNNLNTPEDVRDYLTGQSRQKAPVSWGRTLYINCLSIYDSKYSY